MKTIGLLGGTGWVSTVEYYRILNEETNRRLGGSEFAKCILNSLNYGDIDRHAKTNDFEKIYPLILEGVKKLVMSDVSCILLCANTLHMFADRLSEVIEVPIIHIADAVTKEIKNYGIRKVGLLGTKPTMEMDFYKNNLNKANIEVLIPEAGERQYIHDTIINELLKEIFREETKIKFLNIIENLRVQGVEGIILGCTEIPLLIKQEDTDIKLFDTLFLHAKAAVDFALE
ncbi:MAG: amino acid racemase [Ignavibacteriae bacterium]|nr:amino acid racemase [Ignavibacteriota bacterium]